MKALVTQAGKRMAAGGGVRLGSRDERRQVYGRFQAAVTEGYAFAFHLRIEAMIAPKVSLTGTAMRDMAKMSHGLQTELLQSYMELMLVGNPGPLSLGEQALQEVGQLLNMGTADQKEFDEQALVVADALKAFVMACRRELWYLPQRWQVYRPAWWRAAWTRRPWKRAAVVEGNATNGSEVAPGPS